MSFPEGPSPHETPRKLASGGGGRGLSRCSLPCGFRYRNLEISPLEAAKIGIFVIDRSTKNERFTSKNWDFGELELLYDRQFDDELKCYN